MHRTTSRILIGEKLCRNEEYISKSMAFANSIFINGVTLALFPMGPFRRQLSWLGSFRHRRDLERTLKLILPVVQQRIDEKKALGKRITPNTDAIDWTIELSEPYPKENNPRTIALQVLHNLWAGSTAPGGLVTQMLFQMLMDPEYLEPLRTESETAISEFGWTEKALHHMPLLDSFMRETNRLYLAGSGKH